MVDAAGNTLLMQCVQRENMDFLDHLVQRRARLNTRNRNGETALSLAAYKGLLPFVKRLVEAGADVNLYGWSPLVYAAFSGRTAVVEYLLGKGAEVNATTPNGLTALLFAARFGHLEVVELLLRNKADPNMANDRGADRNRLGSEVRQHRHRRPAAQGGRSRRHPAGERGVKVRRQSGDARPPCPCFRKRLTIR